jgi:dUTP pyrophosphatase
MMINDENSFEEIKKQFEKIQESEGFIPDEDFENQLNEFINANFGIEMEQEIANTFNTRKVKIKKVHEGAIIPKYNYPSDSGFDLHSVEEVIIPALGRAFVPTGLSFQFEEGLEIQVRSKSGLAINQGLMVLNSPGTVDQGYSGEVKAIVFNTNSVPVTIPKGMKVAQAVLCPVFNGKLVDLIEVDSFEETDRGSNGFGSTGII